MPLPNLKGLFLRNETWSNRLGSEVERFRRERALRVEYSRWFDPSLGTFKPGSTKFIDIFSETFKETSEITVSDNNLPSLFPNDGEKYYKSLFTSLLLDKRLDLPSLVDEISGSPLAEALYGRPGGRNSFWEHFYLPILVIDYQKILSKDGYFTAMWLVINIPDKKTEQVPLQIRVGFCRYVFPDPTGGSEIGAAYSLPYRILPKSFDIEKTVVK